MWRISSDKYLSVWLCRVAKGEIWAKLNNCDEKGVVELLFDRHGDSRITVS